MPNEKGLRRIKLETRHGGSRESRSRKDRPCDICRSRKSACVIAVKPPCRFCQIRGLSCTFTTSPRPRRRTKVSVSEATDPGSDDAVTQDEEAEGSPLDQLSPQASRFPVPPRPPRRASENSLSQSSPSTNAASPSQSTGRQYLSLQQLTSAPDTSPTHVLPFATKHLHAQDQSLSDVYYNSQARSKHTLENGKNLTAHYIGLSGEQDTNLFSSIRYNVLNETKFIDFNVRQVYAGDPIQGTAPIHFSILHDAFPERDQRAKRAASDAIEAHVGSNGESLLRLYFRFVHPIFPILSKAATLSAYATNKLSIPASLRGAIYGLACAFWSQEPSLKHLPPISQAELFDQAHAALSRELDSPKLSTLQACLLVLHQQPDSNGTTESPKIWVLACQATACAQSLGLHHDPTLWNLPSWEKKLRKKLWWATFVTDMWSSICHGNTPHILSESFDTSVLDLDDLKYDEDVSRLPAGLLLDMNHRTFDHNAAVRYLELIKLTKILQSVIADNFTLQSYQDTFQKNNIPFRESKTWTHKLEVDRTISLLPYYLAIGNSPTSKALGMNGPLHLSFFAVKFFILRALMAPATPDSKSNPSSRLRHHFKYALAEGEELMKFIFQISISNLHIFWPRHSRTHLIIAGNFLIYLFFCASTEDQVARAYDMLQRYRELLREMAKDSDWSTIGLIRPSLLRTESFFHGAAEGIRLAGYK